MEHAAAHRTIDGEGKGTLYVVASPIGNLRDITLRALDVLKEADVIAAEDTRITSKLLHHYGIAAKLMRLDEHSARRAAPRLLATLAEGGTVALVSDAGTPVVSDPGATLVAAARGAGHTVSPIPGASAALAALSAAGIVAPHFLFYGFLPARAPARRSELEHLAHHRFPLLFFEAPHRIIECVSDMREVLGEARRVVIARELTKVFESIHDCPLGEAVGWLNADANRCKGEFVLIVEGATEDAAAPDTVQRVLEALVGQVTLKQAVALTARITGARRNAVYAVALQLKDSRER